MNNNLEIKQKLKKDSIKNASLQGVNYKEKPSWIYYVSWIIGGIIGLISFFALLIDKNEIYSAILAGVSFCLSSAIISYIILLAFFYGSKFVKKGAIIVAKKSSSIIDSTTTNITKKISTAMEKGKDEAKLEQEKRFLKEKIKDLELQNLQNRIAELEKELHKKR